MKNGAYNTVLTEINRFYTTKNNTDNMITKWLRHTTILISYINGKKNLIKPDANALASVA